MDRKPINEFNKPVNISRPSACQHDYQKETEQYNESMTSYVCKKCGHGLLIGKSDSIDNYTK